MQKRLAPGLMGIAIWAMAACGGDGGTDNNQNRVLAKTATNSGDGQTAAVATTLPQDLRVVLTEDGEPKPNATIKWIAFTGSVSPTTSVTDGNGIATTSWTIGTIAGPQNARADFVGATGSPQVFSATGVPGSPAALTKAGGDLQTAPVLEDFPNPLQVKISDAFGNGIAGVTANWAVVSGPVTIDATASASNSQGIASIPVSAGGTTGPASIEATSAAVPATTITFGLTVVAAIREVSVGSNFFRSVANNTQNPARDTVQVGQTIRWTNTGGVHTVQSQGSPSFPNSGTLSNVGDTYTHIYATPGTYQYNCAIHGSAMTGVVEVVP